MTEIKIPKLTLNIKAANQKTADHFITCDENWTVKELKDHLASVYPGNPSEMNQRIIHSGKLLANNQVLGCVFKGLDDGDTYTVHLVSPSPGQQEKSPSCINIAAEEKLTESDRSVMERQLASHGIPPEDLPRLHVEYQAYLHSYYYQQMWSQWLHSASNPGMSLSMNVPAGHLNGQAPPGTPPPPPQQPPQEVARQPEGAVQGAGLGGLLPEADPEGGRDPFYFAIRVGMLGLILYAYSSWEKLLLVVLLSGAVYLFQRFVRPMNALDAVVRPAEPVAAVARQPVNDAGDGEEAPAAPVVQEIDRSDVTPVAAVENRRYGGLRAALVTTTRILISFVASLFPDGHPAIQQN